MELKIEYLDIKSLEPYMNNARKHTETDVASIKASIEQFGFSDPVGIWSDHNVIVEGHGRYTAAIELGMDKIPCIRLDHMTDEQRRAYALAHNKTAELSGWDFAMLDTELADIGEIDMSQFGFNEAEIDAASLDELFAPAEPKEKEPKQIQCPHCGEWFDL